MTLENKIVEILARKTRFINAGIKGGATRMWARNQKEQLRGQLIVLKNVSISERFYCIKEDENGLVLFGFCYGYEFEWHAIA